MKLNGFRRMRKYVGWKAIAQRNQMQFVCRIQKQLKIVWSIPDSPYHPSGQGIANEKELQAMQTAARENCWGMGVQFPCCWCTCPNRMVLAVGAPTTSADKTHQGRYCRGKSGGLTVPHLWTIGGQLWPNQVHKVHSRSWAHIVPTKGKAWAREVDPKGMIPGPMWHMKA